MLEMWKVIDPFSKAAWYGTDEHQAYCEDRFRQTLEQIDAAVPVSVSVEGDQQITWMQISMMRPEKPGNVVYYASPEHLKRVREEMILYLNAHANRIRVEVTAKELQKRPPEGWKRQSFPPILKLLSGDARTNPAAKFPGQLHRNNSQRGSIEDASTP